ncbi:hypothetical protein [Pseudomonas lactis]|uniref:hypothetical protein n=1 Tax=Pseudomonas lactis TaxID=1615674 RepID=UPI003F7FC417
MFDQTNGEVFPAVRQMYTPGQALLTRLKSIAATLPILHSPNSTKIRYVLHFSTDANVQSFHRSLSQAWADVICASLEGILTITNAPNAAAYTALYILRIGLADDEAYLEECKFFSDVVRNYPAVCHEYSLGNNVKQGDFGKLTITLNGTDFI